MSRQMVPKEIVEEIASLSEALQEAKEEISGAENLFILDMIL